MNKNYILHIGESKRKYHKNQSAISYEEKFKIILELQKIDSEMRKNNRPNDSFTYKYKMWQLD